MPVTVRCIDRMRLAARPDLPTGAEYLVANGQGGYASATLSGVLTRGYHGLLIAALPEPLGRMVVLSHLGERLMLADGSVIDLSWLEVPAQGDLTVLDSFTLEDGLPVWRYRIGGVELERRLVMPYRQNIVHVTWTLSGDAGATLLLRPMVNLCSIHASVAEGADRPYSLTSEGSRMEIVAGSDLPILRLRVHGGKAIVRRDPRSHPLTYQEEAARGYGGTGSVWSMGEIVVTLTPDQPLTLTAGTDPWREMDALPPVDVARWEGERRRRLIALAPPSARDGFGAELVLAADSFLMAPIGRTADVVR